MKVDLARHDLQLLVQSLEHCLDTCQSRGVGQKAVCDDCDEAKKLKVRLKKALKEVKA